MSKYSVKDLALFLKKSKESGTPFVLFTGAGCSKSAGIPLAGELVDEINRDFELELKGLSKEDRQDYGKCMSVLVKEDRRKLISNYIKEAKINWTHIAIALLIEKGYFQRVLTFNFDNLLARSSGLLGLYPATYDLTTADLDLHNLIVEPAVVHIHGQSHGFTLLNSDEETTKHAENLEHFIASTLNNSPTLFVGYSGYADAFFPILEKKYTGQHRLFWSGRSEGAPEHLSNSLLKSYGNCAHYVQGEDSDIFFIELARALGCFPPKIFENPYEHLLDELEYVTDFPLDKNEHKDMFAEIKQQLTDDRNKYTARKVVDTNALFIEGKYHEIIDFYNTTSDIDPKHVENVALAYDCIARQLIDSTEEFDYIDIYEKVLDYYTKATAVKGDMYLLYYNFGTYLCQLSLTINDLDKRFSKINEGIEQIRLSIKLNSNYYWSLNNLGLLLLHFVRYIDDAVQKEKYLLEAFELLRKAIKINSGEVNAYVVLASVFLEYSKQASRNSEKYKNINKALESLRTAHKIKPDDYNVIDGIGNVYLELYSVECKEEYLINALEVLKPLETKQPSKAYNLACVYALMGEFNECKDCLERAFSAGTLPLKSHMLEDRDLRHVHEEEWFKKLVSKVN